MSRVTYVNGELLYRDVNHVRRNLNPETLRDLAGIIGLPSALRNQVSLAAPN
jgi:hypothetical protein